MVEAGNESMIVGFTVVRRGFEPQQVTDHLERVNAEINILVGDRSAALEQASQLGRQLDGARRDLVAAHAEIERLRADLRVLAGPVINVQNMDERLQVMLRLAHDEFGGMRAEVTGEIAELIDAAGKESVAQAAPDANPRQDSRSGQDTVREIDRLCREAVAERTRLDEAAANRRAKEDEEFRITLAIRCREALAQLTKLQAESLRTAQQVLADADGQVREQLDRAREAARDMIGAAQHEVDDLHALRRQLTQQLDVTRELLDRARPAAPRQEGGPVPARAVASAGTAGADGPEVPEPSAVPAAEHLARASQ